MGNSVFLRPQFLHSLFAISLMAFYWSFSHDLDRTDHFKLFTLYAAVCFFSFHLIKKIKSFYFLLGLSVVVRLIFIDSIPNLSQDFYRFIWDGSMQLGGNNPYLSTPSSFEVNPYWPFYKADQLVEGMGELNASHYTNYPPVCQFVFYLTSWFFQLSLISNVILLRIVLIAADIGTIFIGSRLLKILGRDKNDIFWYALNPLVIIELTGNLHFEGLMIFFLIWSLYLLYKGKWYLSAVVMALSISTKLIPLMFLPLLFPWFKNVANGIVKLLGYYLITGIGILLLFLPYLSSEFLANYAETVGLWFQKFEFNASIYYLFREVGYIFYGYNQIANIGPILAIAVVIFILVLSTRKKIDTQNGLILLMLFSLTFYLFTTTTVHPWYLTTLVALGVFTNYRYQLVWSVVVILSYAAYTTDGFYENPWVLSLEYVIVFGFLIYEIIIRRIKGHHLLL